MACCFQPPTPGGGSPPCSVCLFSQPTTHHPFASPLLLPTRFSPPFMERPVAPNLHTALPGAALLFLPFTRLTVCVCVQPPHVFSPPLAGRALNALPSAAIISPAFFQCPNKRIPCHCPNLPNKGCLHRTWGAPAVINVLSNTEASISGPRGGRNTNASTEPCLQGRDTRLRAGAVLHAAAPLLLLQCGCRPIAAAAAACYWSHLASAPTPRDRHSFWLTASRG